MKRLLSVGRDQRHLKDFHVLTVDLENQLAILAIDLPQDANEHLDILTGLIGPRIVDGITEISDLTKFLTLLDVAKQLEKKSPEALLIKAFES